MTLEFIERRIIEQLLYIDRIFLSGRSKARVEELTSQAYSILNELREYKRKHYEGISTTI